MEFGYCSECGRLVDAIEIDEGIGPYEWWGSIETDVQIVCVSPCCEAEVVERYIQTEIYRLRHERRVEMRRFRNAAIRRSGVPHRSSRATRQKRGSSASH